MAKMVISKQQARQYLIRYQHITDDTALLNDDMIVSFIEKVGCIQFDPLDQVGKNADLVLQARCPKYRKNDINHLLYTHRYLFDVWDKNMSIASVNHWPYFSRTRAYMGPYYNQFQQAIERITGYLSENEFACSSDFDLEEKARWHYGNQRLAKAALECMCYAGTAVVHHKKGTRRYYCLAENFINNNLLTASDPNDSDAEYYKWLVLRRINSMGLLWNRGGDAWLGTLDFKSEHRNTGFNGLLENGRIIEIHIEDIKHPFYIARENLGLLEEAKDQPIPEKNCRILAPLDNFLWERKLLVELFNFDYKWEVYVPAHKRKYGYYVLPVLCGDKFIGRIEMRTNKELKTLIVQSFWWENNMPQKKHNRTVKKCIEKFAKYNLCESIQYDCAPFT